MELRAETPPRGLGSPPSQRGHSEGLDPPEGGRSGAPVFSEGGQFKGLNDCAQHGQHIRAGRTFHLPVYRRGA